MRLPTNDRMDYYLAILGVLVVVAIVAMALCGTLDP